MAGRGASAAPAPRLRAVLAPKPVDAAWRADAIARTPPFKAWPPDAVAELARAARELRLARGERLVSRGERLAVVYLVVEGHVCVGLSAPCGRNVVVAIAPPQASVFGIASMIDGQAMANDVVADEDVLALAIPIPAFQALLAREPRLWKSITEDLCTRARFNVDYLSALLFDPLRARAARLLVGLGQASPATGTGEPVSIALHLPQERLGDMLGVSRQTATALVRGFTRDGLVRWRYGRVTLLDVPALRALAEGAQGATGL